MEKGFCLYIYIEVKEGKGRVRQEHEILCENLLKIKYDGPLIILELAINHYAHLGSILEISSVL